jgi:hypothetical protein
LSHILHQIYPNKAVPQIKQKKGKKQTTTAIKIIAITQSRQHILFARNKNTVIDSTSEKLLLQVLNDGEEQIYI